MLTFLIFFFALWLIRTFRSVLFWVYLWQIKEYHFGRFRDYFRTQKGKLLLLGNLNIAKLGILLLYYFNIFAASILLAIVYLLESYKTFLAQKRKKIIKPVITPKTSVLIILSFAIEIISIISVFQEIEKRIWLSVLLFPLLLLAADILTPLIISLIILVSKPFSWIFCQRMLYLAKKKREQFKDLIVIGISGSYGKTSTKEFLFEILSEKYRVLKTKKNINAEIGIAKTILEDLKPEHQVFIAEIGAYNIGKIREVCRVLQPKIGVLTGINEQHLATFGSQKNIIKAKHEIIECSQLGLEKDKIDLRAENIVIEKEYVSFMVKGVNFKVNVLGSHNIENILLAARTAQELGMSLEEISTACLKIKPAGMTLLKKEGPVVINSSYSANPTGVIADLDYLNIYQGKKLIIMPCLIELGKSSKEIHQRIGRKINQVCDLAVITTKEYFKEIEKESGNKAIYIENPKQIIQKMKEFDIILLEGRVPKEIIRAWEQ